ncbi:hypothetical protein B0T21DRAFT_409360 [Apiosordaria backusii]|uniref:Uncharacterized protein n=1 Tax=Apiosordaria backusii TaxID=314023 RepID=A0AA40K1H7_9PEZI|nr:hypothetical protein B0T21DRAFT_409360 [Apiosordaria backusii]
MDHMVGYDKAIKTMDTITAIVAIPVVYAVVQRAASVGSHSKCNLWDNAALSWLAVILIIINLPLQHQAIMNDIMRYALCRSMSLCKVWKRGAALDATFVGTYIPDLGQDSSGNCIPRQFLGTEQTPVAGLEASSSYKAQCNLRISHNAIHVQYCAIDNSSNMGRLPYPNHGARLLGVDNIDRHCNPGE